MKNKIFNQYTFKNNYSFNPFQNNPNFIYDIFSNSRDNSHLSYINTKSMNSNISIEKHFNKNILKIKDRNSLRKKTMKLKNKEQISQTCFISYNNNTIQKEQINKVKNNKKNIVLSMNNKEKNNLNDEVIKNNDNDKHLNKRKDCFLNCSQLFKSCINNNINLNLNNKRSFNNSSATKKTSYNNNINKNIKINLFFNSDINKSNIYPNKFIKTELKDNKNNYRKKNYSFESIKLKEDNNKENKNINKYNKDEKMINNILKNKKEINSNFKNIKSNKKYNESSNKYNSQLNNKVGIRNYTLKNQIKNIPLIDYNKFESFTKGNKSKIKLVSHRNNKSYIENSISNEKIDKNQNKEININNKLINKNSYINFNKKEILGNNFNKNFLLKDEFLLNLSSSELKEEEEEEQKESKFLNYELGNSDKLSSTKYSNCEDNIRNTDIIQKEYEKPIEEIEKIANDLYNLNFKDKILF